ncbi:MAG TPA: MBL fold metallo-hydrolase [Polyangiaceae bacterium]|jgi:glyoxylase-like metal-dependent hydrolase (beta-lactamase superfamily II)|nr:MBL fold metallo-hydrolase [Polyangiaceae bacterium]
MRPREIARSIALFAARTPTLPPATETNSYALGTREVLLVEPATPYPDEQRAWVAWARGLASEGRRLLAIVATHHHSDHVGGAEVLVRELGVPLWAHAETAARVPLPVARRLEDGEVIALDGPVPDAWQVLHTPGHAPGHVCLWNAGERAAVVGDMVASVGTILIDPVDGDMRAYLAQLDRLARLDARVALPAHGEPIDQPAALFRHYVAHREKREAKIVAALGALRAAGRASPTPEDIVPVAYDDVSPGTWPIALLSVRAHLKKLEQEGRA